MMFTLSMAASVIWDGRRRYFPGIFAISFSLLLISLQCGIFFGLISSVTVPVVESTADIWVTYPRTLACDLARPISTGWRDVLLSDPEVERVDQFIQMTNYWTTKSAVNDLAVVLGTSINDDSLGPVGRLSPYQRALLAEPGSVILDRGDRQRLDVSRLGDDGQVNGRAVRVVGFVSGMMTLTGSCVICSIDTARTLLGMPEDQATFLLVKCRPGVDVRKVVDRINKIGEVKAWTEEEFANQTMGHWISKTKAGIAVAFIALLGLAVGGAVTSQTLYAATSSLMKEFAALRAMGIPRFRMTTFVVLQAFIMSLVGVALGTPIAIALGSIARAVGTEALLPVWLLSASAAVTLVMGLLSGLIATRSLQGIEPANLLR